MMIDDDHISIRRALAHASDEARIIVGTLLSETGIGTRIYVSPERQVLRQVGKLCAVAGFSFGGPVKHFIELIDLVQALEHRRAFSAFDSMKTRVIVPTLHDGGAEFRRQNILKERDVFVH